jgi:hypothetical protein
MKLKSHQSSTQQQIFESPHQQAILWNPGPDITYSEQVDLMRPNPPTSEMVKRAQFVDKTYHWKNAGIRSGK